MYDRQRIRAVIEAQGRQMTWLADAVDCTPEHLSRVLHGQKAITDDMARRIARVLGVPVDLFRAEVELEAAS